MTVCPERLFTLECFLANLNSDKEMPDAAEPSEEPEPAGPAEEEATIDKPAPKQEEPKEQITVVGGRRRGRRQISKRKTVKDDEGYLGKGHLSSFLCV